MAQLDLPTVKAALPTKYGSLISQSVVDTINQLSADPHWAEVLQENFLNYAGILKSGSYTIQQYIDAITYASHRMKGDSRLEAYAHTFPQKYAQLVSAGTSARDINGLVQSYNNTKLVNNIMEQAIIPSWLLHNSVFNEAIACQADLMRNANSEKVRCDAANSLLTHLARPKDVVPPININIQDNSGMAELKRAMLDMASAQQVAIQTGTSSTVTIAQHKIIQGEVVTDE